MGEILASGTEAETCLMVGRGMNGLRGTIVCYNASNQRYTLELDSGEMMSLKARYAKIHVATVEEDNEGEEVPDRRATQGCVGCMVLQPSLWSQSIECHCGL